MRRRADFVEIQRNGAPVHTRHFVVVVAAAGSDSASRSENAAPSAETGKDNSSYSDCAVAVASTGGRLGITVTKKVGNAVTRNRIKRLVREVSRRHRWIPPQLDVVVIAKKHAAKVSGMAMVAKELLGTRERLRKLAARSQSPAQAFRPDRARS